ncbi:MAG TPA: helix-turn-helix domain-containing protein [Acidimicrobiales bacterium]|nr:helix-turn-helix domain-containing protein [Acidimicrobiales bacterium]
MTDSLSSVFAALGDETRRTLYQRLLESANGETATHLAQGATISRQAIAKHLRVLANSGLATVRREGRETRYVPTTQAMTQASNWLNEHSLAWDRRISVLERRIRDSSSAEGASGLVR